MSEDIDLRIVSDKPPGRGARRRLRDAITQALLTAGFKFDPDDPGYRKSGNESRYTIYRLPYEPAATGEGALRPAVQIETAVWPLRRPAVERPVISFVAEALRRPPEIANMACVSILETAADKFVALTRRAGAEIAGLDEPLRPDLAGHQLLDQLGVGSPIATSWFKGTVPCSGFDNPESDPASPSWSRDSRRKLCRGCRCPRLGRLGDPQALGSVCAYAV